MKKLEKINKASAEYQGYRTRICPECNYHLDQGDYECAIGYDEDIDRNYVLIFECPKCFTKSFMHSNKEHLESIEMLWNS